jgi:stage II sporulation protein D
MLTFDGMVMQVFFHASCGGATSRTSSVWGGSSLHISQVVDPYCEGTPYSRWERTFTTEQIAKILGLPPVERIEVEKNDGAGRAVRLIIFLKNGSIQRLPGHSFRMQVNGRARKILFTSPDVLPSTAFTVSKTGNVLTFSGRGYGHGVGMCQWGARVMAEKGFDYKQILKHYFPEMEIERR